MWGNTERVARAVGAGLAEEMAIDVMEVSEAMGVVVADVDLLVVGGPTHAFSMSRPATRADAVTRGAAPAVPDVGIREWIERLFRAGDGALVATFDTRVKKVRRLPGSAAHRAGRALRRRGFQQVLEPESFSVTDVSGPLLDGELERAQAWGGHLGEVARDRRSTRSAP